MKMQELININKKVTALEDALIDVAVEYIIADLDRSESYDYLLDAQTAIENAADALEKLVLPEKPKRHYYKVYIDEYPDIDFDENDYEAVNEHD